MLTMRWTGLRISDAVGLEKSAIKNGVLYVKTKKSKTPVQFPLPDELLNTLAKLTTYENGYYFWDGNSDIKYARLNYGHTISDTFELAGVKKKTFIAFRIGSVTRLPFIYFPRGCHSKRSALCLVTKIYPPLKIIMRISLQVTWIVQKT